MSSQPFSPIVRKLPPSEMQAAWDWPSYGDHYSDYSDYSDCSRNSDGSDFGSSVPMPQRLKAVSVTELSPIDRRCSDPLLMPAKGIP